MLKTITKFFNKVKVLMPAGRVQFTVLKKVTSGVGVESGGGFLQNISLLPLRLLSRGTFLLNE